MTSISNHWKKETLQMLSKDEVAMLESLIRRMSLEEKFGLELWLDDWYDENSDHQLNTRPLQEKIKEAVRHEQVMSLLNRS
jgi:hypothetical protein